MCEADTPFEAFTRMPSVDICVPPSSSPRNHMAVKSITLYVTNPVNSGVQA